MTGWKTVLFNIGLAAGTAALSAAANVNWVEAVGPNMAIAIVAGINIALRFVTKTPVFSGAK